VSATTWTPAAVASRAAEARFEAWRAVEAQHVVSTARLVPVAEQRRLEEILDAAKPPVPPGIERLHYLLAAPFRYRPLPPGSRFRAPDDPGVLYAAHERRTACAEAGWWRWKGFLLDCRGLDELPPARFTLFPLEMRGSAVDLRKAPFARDRAAWQDRESYARTQAFARVAREAGVGIVVYESVRDPGRGANAAALHPRALGKPGQTRMQTWTLLVSRGGAKWIRDGAEAFSFDAAGWE
jgi:hypothetical protein